MGHSIIRVASFCLFTAICSINTTFASMISGGQAAVSPSGAVTYSMPIMIAPGAAGMAPQLSLDFSSQGSDGIAGLGWALSGLSTITHCARTLQQDGVIRGVNFDAPATGVQHRYCIGGERLIAIGSGVYGADSTEYRTEKESFSKIISYGASGNGPSYFKVWTKSGLILEFGNTTDSKIMAPGKTTVAVWALNKRQDRQSNFLTVTYTGTSANGEFYPSRIDYTGNVTQGTPTNNSVQFQYAARATTDTPTTYIGGLAFKASKRLTTVSAYASSAEVTEYRLAYAATTPSELVSITQCDGSTSSSICQPATSFTWTVGTAGTGNNGFGGMPVAPGTPYISVSAADMNRDGKADILTVDASGNMQITYSTGGGASLGPVHGDAGTPFTGLYYDTILADVNGDGRADIVMGDGTVMLSTGSGFAAPVNWGQTQSVVGGYIAVGDVNGDGYGDLLSIDSNGNIYISYSTGTSFGNPVWVGATSPGQTATLADVNGDGLADIVMVDGRVM
ncbi:MAG: FG-GAP-like repeat-containing protein, partial [Burkholderiaceae bacterium]